MAFNELERTAGALGQLARRSELAACERAFAACGIALAGEDLEMLAHAQDEALARTQRIRIGADVMPSLVEGFSSSGCFDEGQAPAEVLADLQETFFCLRDDAPAHVSDAELIAGMRVAFEGEAAGCIEAVASMGSAAVLQLAHGLELDACEPEGEAGCGEAARSSGNVGSAYSLTDDEGRTYRWDPDDWIDDVTADGWFGERWEDD